MCSFPLCKGWCILHEIPDEKWSELPRSEKTAMEIWPMIEDKAITGWWLGHPSEKYESQLG